MKKVLTIGGSRTIMYLWKIGALWTEFRKALLKGVVRYQDRIHTAG